MSNLAKRVEAAANVSIVVVAVLLIAVITKHYLLPSQHQNPTAQYAAPSVPKSGDTVALTGVDWRKNRKTLLLAVSPTCHFCTESGPFYQRLVKEHGDARLITLIPQTVGEGQAYMKKLGVDISDVRQVSFADLGVSGTPTLILVDGGGKVAEAWVGALKPEKENEVLGRLQ